ncbi:hypothetical protein Goshw_024932, partial [Gossypium schwendimanii]|nr:hypothetical protein [Gossypium schwendimanii]
MDCKLLLIVAIGKSSFEQINLEAVNLIHEGVNRIVKLRQDRELGLRLIDNDYVFSFF